MALPQPSYPDYSPPPAQPGGSSGSGTVVRFPTVIRQNPRFMPPPDMLRAARRIMRLYPQLRLIMTLADLIEALMRLRDPNLLTHGMGGWTQVANCGMGAPTTRADSGGPPSAGLIDQVNNCWVLFVGAGSKAWNAPVPAGIKTIEGIAPNQIPVNRPWRREVAYTRDDATRATRAPASPLPILADPRPNPLPLPETYPWHEPYPVPMPMPYRKLPQIGKTPMKDSGYSPPGEKPRPNPQVNPRPNPRPGTKSGSSPSPYTVPMPTGDYVPPVIPDIAIGPINNVRPGQGHAQGPEYTPTIRPGTSHRFQRTPPRVKEQKVRMRSIAAANFVIGAVTETDDTVKAIYQALPKKLQTARNPQQRLQILYRHWDKVDFQQAANNVVKNQVEDAIIGLTSKKYLDIMKRNGWNDPFGPQTRMGNRFRESILQDALGTLYP